MEKRNLRANLKKLHKSGTEEGEDGGMDGAEDELNLQSISGGVPKSGESVVNNEYGSNVYHQSKENGIKLGKHKILEKDATHVEKQKRTKLTSFVYKTKSEIPANVILKETSDDFATPPRPRRKNDVKISAASKPRSVKRLPKRQINIKNAFLRSEQLFSEVSAQHCIADNFSPDDIQLALVLSKSEHETVGFGGSSTEREFGQCDNKEELGKQVRDKLQEYGFRTGPKRDYGSVSMALFSGSHRQRKSKWASKFTPLTLRNQESQQKKINENIDNLLRNFFLAKDTNSRKDTLLPYKMISSSLELMQQFKNLITLKNYTDLPASGWDEYFVRDLFKVATTEAGYLLKDWSQIPGRDLSPTRSYDSDSLKNASYKKSSDCAELKNVSTKINRRSETLVCTNKPCNFNDPFESIFPKHISSSAPTNATFLEEPLDENTKLCKCSCNTEINCDVHHKGLLSLPVTQMQRSKSPDLFEDSDSDNDHQTLPISTGEERSKFRYDNGIKIFESFDSLVPCKQDMTATNANCGRFSLDPEGIIDLTQSDDDAVGDDLMLSDDEINYSILKAQSFYPEPLKINFKKSSGTDLPETLYRVSQKEFTADILNYENSIKSSHNSQPITPCKRTEIENQNKSDYLGHNISRTLSQSFIESPSKHSNNELSTKPERTSNHSFSKSPSTPVEPLKRKNYEKFNNLLNEIECDRNSELDEFDKLVNHGLRVSSMSFLNEEISEEMEQIVPFMSPYKKKSVAQPFEQNKQKELIINGKTYLVSKTHCSKPKFEQQTNSALLKQLYNFGVKPLKKAQTVKLLEYIYNQTHPLVTPFTENLKKDTESALIETQGNADGYKKLKLEDCYGNRLLKYSQELSSTLVDENFILQTNVTKKTPQPLLPFHIAWFNLVSSSSELYERILMYKPIDLKEIYLFLKGLGYRYDPKDMKIYFDLRCIIFRYDFSALAEKT